MKKTLFSILFTLTLFIAMPLQSFAASSYVEITEEMGKPRSTSGIPISSGGTLYIDVYNYNYQDVKYYIADSYGNVKYTNYLTNAGENHIFPLNLSAGTYRLYMKCIQSGLGCHADGYLSN